MTKPRSLFALSVPVIAAALASPSVSLAQRWADEANVGGLNRLFDRWVDNRRAARGLPPSNWPPRGYYDPDDDTIGNRLADRIIDNRRAARGLPPSNYSTVYGWNKWMYQPGYSGRIQPSYSNWHGQSYYQAPVQTVPDNMVHLRMSLPSGAKVWIENKEMPTTDATQMFESPVLTPGKEYTYHIKVQWKGADGKEVTRTRNVDVKANSNIDLDMRQ